MLDLQSFKEKSFELKMFDGEILKIKRPSQKMVIEMMGYEDTFKKNKNLSNRQRLERLYKFFKVMDFLA